MEIISKRIKELRLENKLTQQQLGNLLSVSQDNVSLWENNKSYPNAQQIIVLTKIFIVSSDYILGLTDY